MKEKVCEKEIMVRLIIYDIIDIHVFFFTVKGQGKRILSEFKGRVAFIVKRSKSSTHLNCSVIFKCYTPFF